MGQIRIFSDTKTGKVTFDGSTISDKEIGSVEALPHPTENGRIIIRSTRILKRSSTTNFRVFLKRLRASRVQNEAGETLTEAPYNYTRDQVVDYLNQQFRTPVVTEYFEYNPVSDRLVAQRDVQVDKNGFFLGDKHKMASGGSNIYFEDLDNKANSYPVFGEVLDQSLAINQQPGAGVTKPKSRIFQDFDPVKLGGDPVTGTAIDYDGDNYFPFNISGQGITTVTGESISSSQQLKYEIVVNGISVYVQYLSPGATAADTPITWYFDQPLDIEAGTTLRATIYKISIQNNQEVIDGILKVNEGDATPTRYHTQVLARLFDDKEIALQEDLNGLSTGSVYKGVYDATGTGTPALPTGTDATGDFYRVTAPNALSGYNTGDILIYNGTEYDHIPQAQVTQSDIKFSGLRIYDIYVKASYNGAVQDGSILYPFNNIETAIASANDGDQIYVEGSFEIADEIVIPSTKSLFFYGSDDAAISYTNYATTQNGLIKFTGTDYSKQFKFVNIDFSNAGKFALDFSIANKVEIVDCKFTNNGWSGSGLSLTDAEAGAVLGYDSDASSLQAFYAAECSDGGAISISNTVLVEITDNTISNNNAGVKVTDSGFVGDTQGFGFLARNQVYNNVSVGIELESSTGDALAGNRNFTIYNNAVNNHGDDGIKVKGGFDNTLSLGVAKGNWCAGIELAHVSNMRVRDLDLDNNNRSGLRASGSTSHLASVQLEGDTIADGATFIAELFNIQIHNTQLGSNAVKSGLLLKQELGNITGTAAVIKLDNLGFIEQDYAIDVECDLDNLDLVIGDCEYIKSRIKSVRLQGSGKYSELPFSTFTVDTPFADFTKDDVAKTISILDGQNGKVINVYDINSIQAVNNGQNFDIIIRNSDKIQLKGLTEDRMFIDGVAQTGTTNDAVNALNALFTETEGSSPDPVTTPVVNEEGETVAVTTGDKTINPVGDDLYAGDSSGYNHGYVFANTGIDQGGEHYTFQIRREGIIGMGFHKAESTGIYALSSLGTGSGNGNNGYHWSTWFHPTPNGPWTYYGEAANQTSIKSGWYNFKNTGTGADWLADENVLMKAGMDENGHLYLSYYNVDTEQFEEISKKNSASVEGDVFHLVIKFGDRNVRLFDTPKVHLAAEVDSGTAPLGDDTVLLFGSATGNLNDGISITDADDNNDGFVTTASISAAGQFFEFTQLGQYSAWAGLVNEDDFSATTIQSEMNSALSSNNDAYFYAGGYIFDNRDSWQPYGLTDDNGSSSNFSFTQGVGYSQQGNTHFRIGIRPDGKIGYWQSTDGTNFVEAARSVNTVPTDQVLKFLWKGDDANAELTSLTTGTLSSAPALTYYAIESPDGVWHYPLFATAEEANYFDANLAQPSTGSGTHHTHVYVDDLSYNTWYMPDNGGNMSSSVAPTSTTQYLSAVNWNYVATGADSNYAPAAFNQSVSVTEGQALNLQIVPAGATFTTQVVGLPSWATYSAPMITGTAPFVPSDDINLIQVNRTNAYGTSNGTLTLTVANDAAASAIAGGTVVGGSNTKAPNEILPHGNDALIEWDTDLSPGQEMVYTVPSGTGGLAPSIGILSPTGINNLSDYDPSVDTLGQGGTSASPGNNFAYRTQWALRYVTFGGYLGPGNNTEKYLLTGWSDNSTIANNEGYMRNVELKLEYGTDGYMRLYRAGVLLKTSANTFSGAQTIYFAGFDENNSLYVPSNLVIRDTAFTGSAISGWTHLTGSGGLSASDILGEGSAVQLDIDLQDGERLVFTKEWVEANILPYMAQDEDSSDSVAGEQSVYLGVLRDNADVTDGISHTDFEVGFEWFNNDATRAQNNHRLKTISSGVQYANVGIGSTTASVYDFAFNSRGGVVEALAASELRDVAATEPSLANLGIWQQSVTNSTFANGETVSIVIGTRFGKAGLSNTGVSKANAPLTSNEFNVTEDTFSLPLFNGASGSSITLNAGQTYKFYLGDSSIESTDALGIALVSDNSDYTTGVTVVGTPGTPGAYLEFAIPSDVPPIKFKWTSGGVDYYVNATVSGSTYVTSVTGVTPEGPNSNFTGTLIDAGTLGWLSIDDDLTAGQRIVLDSAFITDLHAAMPDYSIAWVGLKASNWTNTSQPTGAFFGMTAIRFYKTSSAIGEGGIRILGYANGGTSNQVYTASLTNAQAFIEITNSGNNIRVGHTASSSYDATTDTYGNWDANSKVQTGEQGYGITTIEPLFYWDAITGNTTGFDYSDVDWTGMSEIAIPTPPATNATSWDKAIDFSGSNEHLKQVNPITQAQALRLGGYGVAVANNSDSTKTADSGFSFPWATAIVFRIDGNNSNQHIWNMGSGAGNNDKNIYLRMAADRSLYFGWGKGSNNNECIIHNYLQTNASTWYGVYIAFKGGRFNSGNLTDANLADAFDIRFLTSGNWNYNLNVNKSTTANWTAGGNNARTDNTINGDFTIGGRGSNRNFHGKVASMVTTTLKRNDTIPNDAEILKMVTDPVGWVTDYKVGNTYRYPNTTSNYTNFQVGDTQPAYATQVWLMGDGALDSYSNGIRNYVQTTEQNYTKMQFNSMASNDIETVTILGLT